MAKVIVGMSGGVDSAVAAYLLKQEGYDVIGVTLRTWLAADGAENRCCEIDDARTIARRLEIPYYALNCADDFRRYVTDAFTESYIHGLTPNPCVECNRYVKWSRMLYYARVLGAEHVATGHYASVVRLANGRYTVRQAAHAEKDQTYMLYKLTQEQLAATIFPLGGLSKDEVRAIARGAGLSVAGKPDSQEICFVPDGDYADFIARELIAADREDELPGAGRFVGEDGGTLGEHRGIIHYTVGQRRGLRLPLGYPAYVKRIRAAENEVVVGPEDSLYSRVLLCGGVNYMSIPPLEQGQAVKCRAKIRYRHTAQEAVIEPCADGRVRVTFDRPVRAAAPGQSAVFYDDDGCVIGGGIIGEAAELE